MPLCTRQGGTYNTFIPSTKKWKLNFNRKSDMATLESGTPTENSTKVFSGGLFFCQIANKSNVDFFPATFNVSYTDKSRNKYTTYSIPIDDNTCFVFVFTTNAGVTQFAAGTYYNSSNFTDIKWLFYPSFDLPSFIDGRTGIKYDAYINTMAPPVCIPVYTKVGDQNLYVNLARTEVLNESWFNKHVTKPTIDASYYNFSYILSSPDPELNPLIYQQEESFSANFKLKSPAEKESSYNLFIYIITRFKKQA